MDKTDRDVMQQALEALELAEMNGEAGLRKYETLQIAEAAAALRAITRAAAEIGKDMP